MSSSSKQGHIVVINDKTIRYRQIVNDKTIRHRQIVNDKTTRHRQIVFNVE